MVEASQMYKLDYNEETEDVEIYSDSKKDIKINDTDSRLVKF